MSSALTGPPPCGCHPPNCQHRDHPQLPAQRECREGVVPTEPLAAEHARPRSERGPMTTEALAALQARVRAHLRAGGDLTEYLQTDELTAVAEHTVDEGLDALVELDTAISRYRACQRRIGRLLGELQVALRPGTEVKLYDMVRLADDYEEHPDNVGAERTGRYLKRGTGDWEGYLRVDFTASGGRVHYVPDSAVRPA